MTERQTNDPLNYLGVRAPSPPNFVRNNREPITTDNGFDLGTIWLDSTTSSLYVLVSVEAKVARWDIYAGGTSGFPISPFVVGKTGDSGFSTIQSALDAANDAGGNATVYVQPGTYLENLTLYSTVDIVGSVFQGIILVGSHTPPSTGNVLLQSMILFGNPHIIDDSSAGSSSLFIDFCLTIVNGGFIYNLPNWNSSTLFIHNVIDAGSSANGIVNNSGGASISLLSSNLGGGNSVSMVTSGGVSIDKSNLRCPWTQQAGTSVSCIGSGFSSPVSAQDDSSGFYFSCSFSGGTSAAFTMDSSGDISLVNGTISSTNTNTIEGSGSGTLSIDDMDFIGSSEIISGLTLNTGVVRGAGQLTRFLVGNFPDAPYSTIQDGLDAANTGGGGIVYVQPGTYTEDLTFYPDTQLIGTPGNSDAVTSGNTVVIIGVHSPSTSGSNTIKNISLESATDIFNSSGTGTAPLLLQNVTTAVTDGFIFNLPNWVAALTCIDVREEGTDNGVIMNFGGSICTITSSVVGNGTNNAMSTVSPVTLNYSTLQCPWTAASNTVIEANYSSFTQPITTSENCTGSIRKSTFITGSNAAIIMNSDDNLELTDCIVDSQNSIPFQGDSIGTLFLNNMSVLDQGQVNEDVITRRLVYPLTGSSTVIDAATDNIISWDVPKTGNRCLIFDVFCCALATGPDAAGYRIIGVVKSNGVTVTVVGTPDLIAIEDAALSAATVDVVVSGTTVNIQVTGVAGLTTTWSANGTLFQG